MLKAPPTALLVVAAIATPAAAQAIVIAYAGNVFHRCLGTGRIARNWREPSTALTRPSKLDDLLQPRASLGKGSV